MKKSEFFRGNILKIKIIILLMIGVFYLGLGTMSANRKVISKRSSNNTRAFYTGVYRNLFLEAGYSQSAIDQKVAKTYSDLFEGPNRIYFEVGDSMGYVSDLKNHDARTEGLSYGMMIAVQLNKKDVFDRIWRWSKKYL
ncbi:MAG: glycosyl hydrolase family 8, partial [Bacteroidota bacterium]|nr:glycosyl hydrolase family 8 [Bacteroidota bacterium]